MPTIRRQGGQARGLLAEKFLGQDVEILRLHQLTPEVADTLRGFAIAIFIDAASNEGALTEPGSVRLEEIFGGSLNPARFSHAFSPQRVLALAAELYDVHPRAFCLTVTGASFDHGDSLSPAVADALPSLISTVERLLRDAGPKT
jgi:hydrogenase maturation protease